MSNNEDNSWPREYVVVVGAGPAGLAVAYCLHRQGVIPLVLDRATVPGASWRFQYRRPHLDTVRWLSHLPGRHFARHLGRWVPREQVADYLSQYASVLSVRIETQTTVRRVDRTSDGWSVLTDRGQIPACHVVIATGLNCTPVIPEWEGRSSYKRTLLHANAYTDASSCQDRYVLVIGAGNSGSAIALDLLEGGAAHVALAIGTPPNFVPRAPFGIPLQVIGILTRPLPVVMNDALGRIIQWLTIGNLSPYGVPKSTRGIHTQTTRDHHIPTIDVGTAEEIRRGRIEVVPAVIRLDGDEVILSDGRRLAPDVIIAATGYQTGLDALVGHLGVLDQYGLPLVRGGRPSLRHSNLYFVGFDNVLSGNLREMGIEARRVAQHITFTSRQ